MESKLMTDDEKAEIFRKVYELEAAGRIEDAELLRRTVPIPAFVAKIFRDKLGTETLEQCNFNLAEAEVKYGQDWLT